MCDAWLLSASGRTAAHRSYVVDVCVHCGSQAATKHCHRVPISSHTTKEYMYTYTYYIILYIF